MSDAQAPYSSTREARRIYEAAYRERSKSNPERLAKRREVERDWRKRNPEKVTAYNRSKNANWRANKAYYLAFKTARRRAGRFGIEFAITIEWAEQQFSLGSALSGLPFGQEYGAFSPSIDRVDSALGYTPDNCRMVLLAENLFKNEWLDADIIAIAKAIARRNP
jgi:hypothetical protein